MKKYKGIKKVASETKRIDEGWNRVQVFYDTETDEIWCEYFPDTTTFTQYHDDSVISFFATTEMKMSEIKDEIEKILSGFYD